MPRSFTGLWERITSWENIVSAYNNARKGKKLRSDVMVFHRNIEENLCRIHESLLDGTWDPKPFNLFERITEGKRRQIEAPVFADRVVHHAIVRVLEPAFDRKFIFDSYSCRKGKGTHAAADRLERFIRQAGAKWERPYALKCDIAKFFPSIDHGILWDILERTIRESAVIDLIKRAAIAPGNITGKGLPIGALTSQLLANVYMNELDHFAKDCAGCRFYIRYADDFVFLDGSKETLQMVLDDVAWLLDTHLRLRLNPKTSIFPLFHGLDFCGYRIWATHRLPRKRVVQAAKRRFLRTSRLYAAGAAGFEDVRAVVASFLGYMQHCSGRKSADSVLKRLLLRRG